MPKTIDDIIPPSRRRPREYADDGMDSPPPSRAPRARGRFPFGLVLIAIIIIIACIAALYIFSGATVTVTPVINQVSALSTDLTATQSTGDLPYETITVSKIGSNTVPGEGTITANDPAQGTITIYNAQTTVQQLVKNTRFATPAGLIFRIRDGVTVPAGTADKPGTVTTSVYADQGGATYNVAATTFSVPGLKGSKAYDLVYAKSTDPMTGGFSGTRPSVASSTEATQDTNIQTALKSGLQSSLAAQVPAGYVLVPGATFLSFAPQPDTTGSSSNSVLVSVKGSATAVVFPSEGLAKAIAYKAVGSYGGQPVKLVSTDGLTLTPDAPGIPAGPSFSFTLAGSVGIEWEVDASRIAGAVAGKSRSAAQGILSGFPEVERAVLVLKPFWETSFPSDPAKITVTVVEPSSTGN